MNAIQAIEEARRADGGKIQIRTWTTGSSMVLEIEDDGCGIPPENLGLLYDPFFTTKPVGEGTGLGLAITHGIVTGHGGGIEVASTVGKGTCFRVTLPLRVGTESREVD